MNRRAFIVSSLAGLATPLGLKAQQASKVWRIGVVGPGLPTSEIEQALAAFRNAVREHGHQVEIEYRWPAAVDDPLLRVADEIVALRLDILVVWGERPLGPPPLFNRSYMLSPPPTVLVLYNELKPSDWYYQFSIDAGIAGVSATRSTLVPDQIEIVTNLVPGTSRLAILWDQADRGSVRAFNEAFAVAKRSGVQPHGVEARNAAELEPAFAAAASRGADALLVITSATSLSHAATVVRLAARHRLPAIYSLHEFAEMGGLASYGTSLHETLRRAATYVDRIATGAGWPPVKSAVGVPIEPAPRLGLVINLKTARALGITIPPSLLLRADQVIDS